MARLNGYGNRVNEGYALACSALAQTCDSSILRLEGRFPCFEAEDQLRLDGSLRLCLLKSVVVSNDLDHLRHALRRKVNVSERRRGRLRLRAVSTEHVYRRFALCGILLNAKVSSNDGDLFGWF